MSTYSLIVQMVQQSTMLPYAQIGGMLTFYTTLRVSLPLRNKETLAFGRRFGLKIEEINVFNGTWGAMSRNSGSDDVLVVQRKKWKHRH